MSSKSFVRIITSRMKEKNIGIRQLARLCGIDASFISKVIQGKRNPPADEQIIKKISSVLSVDPMMLTIYTGRIPSPLQSVLEDQSFVDGLLHKKRPVFEKETPVKNVSVRHNTVSIPSRHIIADRKTYQKSELTDELL